MAIYLTFTFVKLAQTGDSITFQSIVEATFVMLRREVRRQVQEVRDRLAA